MATTGKKIEAGQPLTGAILKAARRSDEPMLWRVGQNMPWARRSLPGGGVVVAGLPMPAGLNAIVADLSTGTSQYWALYRQRRIIRMTYFLLLLMLTALVFFASSWLALNCHAKMTGPLEALADATVEIGKGHYSHRVTAEATAEIERSWCVRSMLWPPIWSKAACWRKRQRASFRLRIWRSRRGARNWRPSSRPFLPAW